MANSPTDVGDEFKKSGMTLISQQASDYWLKKARENKIKREKNLDYLERMMDS